MAGGAAGDAVHGFVACAQNVQIAKALYRDKRNSVTDICRTLRVSRTTFYRYIKEDLRWSKEVTS